MLLLGSFFGLPGLLARLLSGLAKFISCDYVVVVGRAREGGMVASDRCFVRMLSEQKRHLGWYLSAWGGAWGFCYL